jgi:hypothetical protein
MDLRNVGIYHNATQRHNPEDLDLNLRSRENLKTRMSLNIFFIPFLGSTAQLRPWPPPKNSAEFFWRLLNFLFYRVGLLAPRPTPIPEDQASVFISPRGRVAQLYPWAPILVASYDTHGLRWDCSYSVLLPFLLLYCFHFFDRGSNSLSQQCLLFFNDTIPTPNAALRRMSLNLYF